MQQPVAVHQPVVAQQYVAQPVVAQQYVAQPVVHAAPAVAIAKPAATSYSSFQRVIYLSSNFSTCSSHSLFSSHRPTQRSQQNT